MTCFHSSLELITAYLSVSLTHMLERLTAFEKISSASFSHSPSLHVMDSTTNIWQTRFDLNRRLFIADRGSPCLTENWGRRARGWKEMCKEAVEHQSHKGFNIFNRTKVGHVYYNKPSR